MFSHSSMGWQVTNLFHFHQWRPNPWMTPNAVDTQIHFIPQQGHIARTCLNTIEFGWFRRFESEFRVAHCSMNDALKSKLNDSKHSHLQNKKSRNKASTCYFQMLHLSFHRLPLMHNDVCTTAQDHAKTAFLTHRRRTRNQRGKVLPIHMLDVRATGLFSSILQFLSSQFLSILHFTSSQFLNSGHPNLDNWMPKFLNVYLD